VNQNNEKRKSKQEELNQGEPLVENSSTEQGSEKTEKHESALG